MKRILFMTHVGMPGGAEFKMLNLCESREHECAALLFEHGPLEQMLAERDIACSVLPLPGAAAGVRRAAGLGSLLRSIPATLSMIRGVARHARRHDVVVCFSQKSFVITALAKPFMRRPVCWFMNDILSREHFAPWLMRVLVELSRGADHVVLNSQASLDAWLAAGGRRTRVSIEHPMTRADVAAARLRDPEKTQACRQRFGAGRPLVGMFGRICPWKGQDVFLRALAKLPGVNGLIAGGALFGEQAYAAELHALARELGVAERVTFAGHVQDVPTAMAACDVVAHCSTSPEPFGRVIVEAMFVGTPVIASDAGGAREIVTDGETGLLTPMRDADALARAIRRYLEQPEWTRSLIERARAHAQATYSESAMDGRIHKILAEI